MKRAFLLVLIGLLLLSLAGCSPAPADGNAMTADVAERLTRSGGEADVQSLEVIKRQTDKRAKTDLVYVQVDYATPTAERSEKYKLTYGLYNEGWILDEMEPYEPETWAIKPLAGPDEETVAAVLPEGAELLDSQFDAETGTQAVQYRVAETHTYCDMERTEQLTLTLDSATEQWQAGEPELLEQDQDWSRLLGLWELESYDDDGYEMQIAVLPFEQAQLDGYVGYEAMGTNRKWYSTADICEDDTSVVRLTELLEPVEGEALPTFRSTLGDDSLFRLDPDDGLVYIWQGKPDQEAAMEVFETGGLTGTAGDITWSVDADWTLTVEGSGFLPPSDSYWGEPDQAWKDHDTYFRLCSALVVQPGITAIGDRAFWSGWFSSVQLPEGLERIGQRAFSDCERLTDIQLPEGLKAIGARAFSGTALTSVVIPDSVTYIGDGAFAGCEQLEYVQLPQSVELGEDVFDGCTALQDAPEPTPAEDESEGTGGKTLVAYFSCTGNTADVAGQIAAATGADLYEIVPAEPYTDADLDYGDSSSRSTVEQNDDSARPTISGGVENMEQYDTVFIGYPIWWGDLPTIVKVFLRSYDFTGKTIVPFCTHAGSGLSGTPGTIEDICPDASVGEGLAIRGSTAQNDRDSAAQSVESWLADGGYIN